MTTDYGHHWPTLRVRVLQLAPGTVTALDARYENDPSLAETDLAYLIDFPSTDAEVIAAAEYFAK